MTKEIEFEFCSQSVQILSLLPKIKWASVSGEMSQALLSRLVSWSRKGVEHLRAPHEACLKAALANQTRFPANLE